MMEFKSFCYLQNQKTGCTFVEKFLLNFSNEPLVYSKKHDVIKNRNYNKDKFYFINVREPINLYLSLFKYGLDGKGEVYLRLRKLGYDSLYKNGINGFSDWVLFIINPKHCNILHPNYSEEVANQFGFMTWRFLRLACYGFESTVRYLNPDERVDLSERLIVNKVIKQETLREDLIDLVKNELLSCVSNADDALHWLRFSNNENESTKRNINAIEPLILEKIKFKEAYIYRRFYKDL